MGTNDEIMLEDHLDETRTSEDWQTLPLPLRLRMGGEFITLSRWTKGDYDPGALLSGFSGGLAQLCLDETPLANVRVDRRAGGQLFLTPLEGSWLCDEDSLEEVCRDLPVTLALRIGRGEIPLSDLGKLTADSLHPLTLEGDSCEARVYLPEFNLEVARGEVLSVGEHFGLRITAMEIRIPPVRSKRQPVMGYSCELGRSSFPLADLLKMGAGTIVQSDTSDLGPAALVMENGISYPAYPLYRESGLTLWIPSSGEKAPSGKSRLRKSPSSSVYGAFSQPVGTSWQDWAELVSRTSTTHLMMILEEESAAWGALVLAALDEKICADLLSRLELDRVRDLAAALGQLDLEMVPSGVWNLLCGDWQSLMDLPRQKAPSPAEQESRLSALKAVLPEEWGNILPEVKGENSEDSVDTQSVTETAAEPAASEAAPEEKNYTFDDLSDLTDPDFQILLGDLEEDEVVKAMLGTGKEFAHKVYRNIPEDVAETLREDLSYVGEIPESAVGQARARVLEVFEDLRARNAFSSV